MGSAASSRLATGVGVSRVAHKCMGSLTARRGRVLRRQELRRRRDNKMLPAAAVEARRRRETLRVHDLTLTHNSHLTAYGRITPMRPPHDRLRATHGTWVRFPEETPEDSGKNSSTNEATGRAWPDWHEGGQILCGPSAPTLGRSGRQAQLATGLKPRWSEIISMCGAVFFYRPATSCLLCRIPRTSAIGGPL